MIDENMKPKVNSDVDTNINEKDIRQTPDRKAEQIHFRVSAAFKSYLEATATNMGFKTLTDFIIWQCLKKDNRVYSQVTVDTEAIRNLYKEISAIGNNCNQITRALNIMIKNNDFSNSQELIAEIAHYKEQLEQLLATDEWSKLLKKIVHIKRSNKIAYPVFEEEVVPENFDKIVDDNYDFGKIEDDLQKEERVINDPWGYMQNFTEEDLAYEAQQALAEEEF